MHAVNLLEDKVIEFLRERGELRIGEQRFGKTQGENVTIKAVQGRNDKLSIIELCYTSGKNTSRSEIQEINIHVSGVPYYTIVFTDLYRIDNVMLMVSGQYGQKGDLRRTSARLIEKTSTGKSNLFKIRKHREVDGTVERTFMINKHEHKPKPYKSAFQSDIRANQLNMKIDLMRTDEHAVLYITETAVARKVHRYPFLLQGLCAEEITTKIIDKFS